MGIKYDKINKNNIDIIRLWFKFRVSFKEVYMAATNKETRVSVIFDNETIQQIQSYAQANEMDVSKVIRLSVKKFLMPLNGKTAKQG